MRAAGLADAEAKDVDWRSCGYVRSRDGKEKMSVGQKSQGHRPNESWDTSSVSRVLWH